VKILKICGFNFKEEGKMLYSEEEKARIDKEVAKLGEVLEEFVKLGKKIGIIKEEREMRKLERTKKGLPAVWEQGGGASRTGWSVIVTGQQGQSLEPVYVKRRGELSCGQHALFIVKPGYHIIIADQHRGDYEITIERITEIKEEENEFFAETDLVCTFSRGEWDKEPEEFLKPAVVAAMAKADCYHCREPHYMREEGEDE
jgi:hypothetical protein